MLDLKNLQNNFDEVAKKLKNKKVDENILKKLAELFASLKKEKIALEEFQAFQNKFSKELATAEDKESLKAKLSENKSKINEQSAKVNALENELEEIAHAIPNIPDECVPVGEDENENVELKKVLNPPSFDFTPKEHFELGESLNWLDFIRGVKISQSRFCVLKNEGALLSRALVNYMIDFNRSRGFEFVNVPFLVNGATMFGTGQLPKFKEDMYKVDDEDLYLISTSEIPVTNLYSGEILASETLPIKMTCYSACFRKEAGSAGRDTRGIIRQHQFEKVELVSITKTEQSDSVFNEMLECASDLLSSLGLAHRHLMLCTGDLGFSAAKTVDLEVWLPGQNKYREISSVSNCRDFQARRAKIRYKNEQGKNELVHTLNGSSLAVGRTLVAIMENYQDKEGKIHIPDVLKKYF
ncbi:serine--tRNA ligase [Campylobacter jejuni]|uniref:Serine--tRNA ligase n=1 Tax=Campylobacter jejuni (strain RM1221) TaxID=195099 RepID=SYS_CAMJR|nr:MULTISPECIES: serine--tRNA ligase [Campylobacter]Q5HW78.1 RecName: Full=Serine--tRNA ligase; AltName: Full=Seryl-tRNA synthetase; Short=SerRS; AltName: Full=Seryl-tRNA(Ser/Sec) synthetase [Campylobacter jejuni RM1221]AAW35027.1 seryl-tRNA synthetase [Campylobacter jejuni RM1221]ADT72141.1 Seryl-tRNA synthetase [Campylobacter jejuni subsp. jejuni S3]ATL96022.1 serine--tRNA ligase [Campylobacter jejuni]EAB5289985.1 serine--tRNA ligase [Campylobacter jejuni]EAC1394763.1 serine--tRNA ligase [C